MATEEKKIPWWLEALGWGLFASVGWKVGDKVYKSVTEDEDDNEEDEEEE